MAPTAFTCRYCGRKDVSRSLGGLKSHISQTPPCRQKRDEEHRHLPSLKRKRDPPAPVEANETPLHASDNIDNTGDEEDGDPHPKRAHTEAQDPSGFQPTRVTAIVDYPEEAAAGAIIEGAEGGCETRFQKISREQQKANREPWAPFNNLSDWELARWLIQSSVSQGEIDKFLKLEAVRTRDLPFTEVVADSHPDPNRRTVIFSQQIHVLQED